MTAAGWIERQRVESTLRHAGTVHRAAVRRAEAALPAAVAWYVGRTSPRSEERAETGLRMQGFEVYLPRGEKEVRVRHQRKPKVVRFPLLTGYVFVGLSRHTPGFFDLRRVDGLKGLLGRADGAPQRVGTAEIEAVRAMEVSRVFEAVDKSERRFKPGDVVRVADGVLEGLEFVFDDYFGKASATIVRSLTGQDRPLIIPLDNLSAAA